MVAGFRDNLHAMVQYISSIIRGHTPTPLVPKFLLTIHHPPLRPIPLQNPSSPIPPLPLLTSNIPRRRPHPFPPRKLPSQPIPLITKHHQHRDYGTWRPRYTHLLIARSPPEGSQYDQNHQTQNAKTHVRADNKRQPNFRLSKRHPRNRDDEDIRHDCRESDQRMKHISPAHSQRKARNRRSVHAHQDRLASHRFALMKASVGRHDPDFPLNTLPMVVNHRG